MRELHLFSGAGGESLAECFSDIPQFVLLRLNLIAEKSSFNASETESCPSSQSGMMSKPSMGNLGVGLSMPSVEDSPARILAKPTEEMESLGKVLMEKGADCGLNLGAWFSKLDLDTYLWKIPQCSLFGDSEQSLGIWPKWGIMRNGECFELRRLGFAIDGKESSSLPTPTASDAFRLRFKVETFKKIYERRKETKTKGDGTLGTVLPTFHQKRPSPKSYEIMMNFPGGWTELKPLEMPKFQTWQDSHGRH